MESKKTVKMKQLELEFTRILSCPERGDQEQIPVEKDLEDEDEGPEVAKEGPMKKKVVTKKVKKSRLSKKKQIAAVAARNQKMTSWLKDTRPEVIDMIWEDVPDPVDPIVIVRREEAKRKKEHWLAKNMATELVLELCRKVEAESVSRMMMKAVVDRAWSRIKCNGAWSWLEGDLGLQKTIGKMIKKVELDTMKKIEDEKRVARLKRKEELELRWAAKRKSTPEDMDTQDDFAMDKLEEMMRCWSMMVELEDASSSWRTWNSSRLPLSGVTHRQSNWPLCGQKTGYIGQDEYLCVKSQGEEDDLPVVQDVWHGEADGHEDEVVVGMDWHCSSLADCVGQYRVEDQCMDIVEHEVVEHAYLDIMKMELGLDKDCSKVTWSLGYKEEKDAHEELDDWLEDLAGSRSQEEGCHGVTKEELCSRKAYYEEGTWFLNRWVEKTSTKCPPTNNMIRGKNVAVGICGVSILSVRIVQATRKTTNKRLPSENIKLNNVLNNILCSGSGKRKVSGRSGRWCPTSGGRSGTTRSPWRSTTSARHRLQNLRKNRRQIVFNGELGNQDKNILRGVNPKEAVQESQVDGNEEGGSAKDIMRKVEEDPDTPEVGVSSSINDKDTFATEYWAKESFVPGTGRSSMAREHLRRVNNTINIKARKPITITDKKPGGSCDTAQDNPGKDNLFQKLTVLLQGADYDDRDAGQVCEGGVQGAHGGRGPSLEGQEATQPGEHVHEGQAVGCNPRRDGGRRVEGPELSRTGRGAVEGGQVCEEGLEGAHSDLGDTDGAQDAGVQQHEVLLGPQGRDGALQEGGEHPQTGHSVEGGVHVREGGLQGDHDQQGGLRGAQVDGPHDREVAPHAQLCDGVHQEGGQLQVVRGGVGAGRVGHVKVVKGKETVQLRKRRGFAPDGLVQMRIQNFVESFPNLGGGRILSSGANRVNPDRKRKFDDQVNDPDSGKKRKAAD